MNMTTENIFIRIFLADNPYMILKIQATNDFVSNAYNLTLDALKEHMDDVYLSSIDISETERADIDYVSLWRMFAGMLSPTSESIVKDFLRDK